MSYEYNGSPLALDTAWTDTEGTQYPSNSLRNATSAQRAAVPSGGVTLVSSPKYYDTLFYYGVDSPRDVAKLKTQFVEEQKQIAANLLKDTDWLVIRKVEDSSKTISSDITTYRANVRTVSGTREGEINAAANTAALETVYKSGLTAWPTKPS